MPNAEIADTDRPLSNNIPRAPPWWRPLAPHWLLLLGLLAITVPTMASVARESWSTEQGAHGPIVLATGIWLVLQLRREFVPLIKPGRLWLAMLLLLPILTIYVLARI